MDSEFKRRLSPSLSLLVLAALTPPEHQVSIADANVGPIDTNDQPDLVGITVAVDTSLQAYQIAGEYRRRHIPVVLGGIHVSANLQEAMAHADTVCVGEAEGVWEQILSDAQNQRLKPVYQNTEPVDLSLVPLPRWELLDSSQYLYTCILCASRGCPFRCEFCYNSCDYIQPRYRNRPVDHVLREIERLGTREVMFIDDNFIGNPEWTRHFLREIRPMGFRWHAAVSTNIGQDMALLDDMRASGCESLFIGFESINSGSIHEAHKTQNHVDRYEKTIREIHDRDIMVNASMVFGFDEDRPDVFTHTLSWLVANKIETMTAHILTPYPGTRLYRRLQAEGRIFDHDPTHYNTSRAVFLPKNMTPEALCQGYLWIYDAFYSWGNIWKRLPVSRRQRLPYLLFNVIYRKYGKFTAAIARYGFMHRLGELARRLSYGID